ncbi:hypothetical protein VR44_11495 [Streptomyces katrae]|uniref:Uncharacterized protein n=1 Tax=Streptomyces katrae TaxID=68223 RepID=A0A0F4JK26_9ACTN|nr:hypothetical protein VR44_11495 [Streptomyces katrae]
MVGVIGGWETGVKATRKPRTGGWPWRPQWEELARLRVELEHRGLLREWGPVPADPPRAGQTAGVTGPHAGPGLTSRLVIALPETRWAPLVRGVHWTNQPHVEALQAWADRWGAGPAAEDGAAALRIYQDGDEHFTAGFTARWSNRAPPRLVRYGTSTTSAGSVRAAATRLLDVTGWGSLD